MTAVPKHWPSSRRQGKRRASQNKTKLPQLVKCPSCQEPKRVGLICPNCQK